jgi:archaellum component FlaC
MDDDKVKKKNVPVNIHLSTNLDGIREFLNEINEKAEELNKAIQRLSEYELVVNVRTQIPK